MRMIFLAFFVLVAGVLGAEWDYEANGGDWTGVCGTGTSQSPIALVQADAEQETFTVTVTESNTPDSGTVKNNGHSLVYTPNTDGAVTVQNPMNDDAVYVLAQFHFHWDEDGAAGTPSGSEHTLDGDAYPLELHFVHYKQEYGSLADAVANDDGLMVIGQFFEVDDTAENAELDKVIDAAEQIVEYNASHALSDNVRVKSLMTTNTDIMHYSGSLTTPGCNEIVSWYVLTTSMGVPLAQLEKLFAMEKDDNTTMGHNWRPTQALNGRTVYRNFAVRQNDEDDDDDHSDHDHGDVTSSAYRRGADLSMTAILVLCGAAVLAPVLLWS